MINILAVPALGPVLRPFPLPGTCACPRDEAHDWSLVERQLLAPPSRDEIACLIRLERADGEAMDWRAGDHVELIDRICRADTAQEPSGAFQPGARHAGICLLPGGWPLQARLVRRARDMDCLPIASSATSGVLDLLLVAGREQEAMLDFAASRALLFETAVKLRLIRSERERMPAGPLLFIGDRGAAAFARALLHERPGRELSILIEDGSDDGFIRSEAVFPSASWRAGTVDGLPRFIDREIFSRELAARRGEIMSFVDRGGHVVIAGRSEDFCSVVRSCLADALGHDIMMRLQVAGRIRKIGGS
jgi:hypothetical protein